MALTLPEILNKILNFLAKDNTLYPALLASKLWFMCASRSNFMASYQFESYQLMGDVYGVRGTMRLEKFI